MEFFAGWLIGILTAATFAAAMTYGIWYAQKTHEKGERVLSDEVMHPELFADTKATN